MHTSNPDRVSFQHPSSEQPMSPSYRPTRRSARPSRPYDSPMLTPSSKRLDFPHSSDPRNQEQLDDFFLQSPFKSPAPQPFSTSKRAHMHRATPQLPAIIPVASGQPLLTPVKQTPQTPVRATLSSNRVNAGHTPFAHKPTMHSTPLRQHTLTPLNITSTTKGSFDRLAPVGFASRTPNSRAEVDLHVGKQTDTLTKLKIALDDDSDDDFGGGLMDEEDTGGGLFLGGELGPTGPFAARVKRTSLAESSPDIHVTKRRVRSRPISRSPSPSPKPAQTVKHAVRNKKSTALPFAARHRRRKSSKTSSSSDSGSPKAAPVFTRSAISRLPQVSTRGTLTRVDSATLFFGPSIPSPLARSRASTSTSSSTPAPAFQRPKLASQSIANRHSYACGTEPAWNTMQHRSGVSPPSSPLSAMHGEADTSVTTDADDDDTLFEPLSINSSFSFNLNEASPSPRKQSPAFIPKKFKPRDSGVVMSDEEDWMNVDHGHAMPQASNSANSLYSDDDDGLVTPGIAPTHGSRWPVIIGGIDDPAGTGNGEAGDVDAFIMRTLAGASRGPQEVKKVPGTPVKKVKTAHLPGDRPWQSAVTRKVKNVFDLAPQKKPPRKSMPAAFHPLGKRAAAGSDTEEDDSPSSRKEKYGGLGLGRPPANVKDKGFPPRAKWLMRRSSSGALSSSSESIIGTPTRNQPKGKQLSSSRRRFSPSRPSVLSPGRYGSGSSSSSVCSITVGIRSPAGTQRSIVRPNLRPPIQEQTSRLERDFVEIDEVGRGEFGKVIKVRPKSGISTEVFAVKKSKRIEGVKHRLRLREEVDVLEHLSRANSGKRHPNVLALIDSWEEDDALFIQTELCELGNFARFLWEYGQVFPQLDEARVWKIMVDLSNGLQFIHGAGVIHLDLKPSNIFVTGEGRFKIGDFGMASVWPRQPAKEGVALGGFEREGDKLYLAPEILRGRYGKAADIFSFGMTMLEAAANIQVPGDGDGWHRLRQEDFSQVELESSPELFALLRQMMKTDPSLRIGASEICSHPVVSRTRGIMERTYAAAKNDGSSLFAASPLASVSAGFLEEILGRQVTSSGAMDLSQ